MKKTIEKFEKEKQIVLDKIEMEKLSRKEFLYNLEILLKYRQKELSE